MTRQLLRRVFAGLVLLLIPLCATPVHAQPPQAPEAPSAVRDYGSCLLGQRQGGDLLLLLDESGSLRDNDKNAARVEAAKRLLDGLAAWADNSGVALDVAIAGFSDGYQVRHDWVGLGGKALPELDRTLDEFRGRDQGRATNYGVALEQSLRTLTSHRPDAGPFPCRAVVWFTDGKLDFEPDVVPGGDVEAAKTTTQESLCRRGGIADQVRDAGVRTFAVGLAADPAANFDLLRGTATGEPTGDPPVKCGSIDTPRPGEFYLARGIAELVDQFGRAVPGQPPVDQDKAVCAQAVRDECKHTFVLDNSIGAVRIDGSADVEGLVPTLVAPTGEELPLEGAAESVTTFAGAKVTHRRTPNAISVTMEKTTDAQWRGQWALAFVDKTGTAGSTRSRSTIVIFGNLKPSWLDADQGQPTLYRGQKTALRLGIIDHDGKPVDPAQLDGTAELSVSMVDAKNKERPLASRIPKDQIDRPVEVDLADVEPGPARLRLTLDITTAPVDLPGEGRAAGTRLEPEPADIAVTIRPPTDFPSPRADVVDFGTLESAGGHTAELAFDGRGCVWLDQRTPPEFAVWPKEVGTHELTSPATSSDGCKPGQPAGSLPLRLAIGDVDNGDIGGTITVTAAPASGEGTATIPVKFTATVQKPVDQAKFWPVLIGTLLLGPGIPLLLLYLTKWLTARIPSRTLKAQQFRIQVRDGTVLRDGERFALRPSDLVEIVRGLDRPARTLDIGDIRLTTRTGWLPFGAGYVTAHRDGEVGASSVPPRTDKRAGDAWLPLAVHNTWFVLHNPAGPRDEATLVLLLGADASPAQRFELAEDACRQLPARLADLRSDSASELVASPGNPFGGTSSGGPFGPAQDDYGDPGDSNPFRRNR
ncbi:VWA domain-containing protein [Rhodococcus koreensis]